MVVIGLALIKDTMFFGAELSGKITVVVYIVSCRLKTITKFKSLYFMVRHAIISPKPTPNRAIVIISKGMIAILVKIFWLSKLL